MPGWPWIPIGFGILNVLILMVLFTGHVMMTSKMYTMVCQIHNQICKKEEEEGDES